MKRMGSPALRRAVQRYGTAAALVVIVLAFSAIRPSSFCTQEHLLDLMLFPET